MGEAEPPPGSLEGWLPTSGADVVCIGLQESAMSKARTKKFFENCLDFLNKGVKGGGYMLVAIEFTGPMRLGLMVRGRKDGSGSKGELHVSAVVTSHENTGLGHVYSNKGGIGIAVTLNASRFMFVSAHFAAHQEMIARRNDDFAEISMGLATLNPFVEACNNADYVFWCGDLNYRIDIDREVCLEKINEGPAGIKQLLKKDQLNIERAEGRVFFGFDEAVIFFPPTYKFETGSRVYATEKNRVPSWCDRILFKASNPGTVVCSAYRSVDHVTTSDHSPVVGDYYVKALPGTKQIMPSPQPVTEARVYITNLRGESLIAKDFGGVSDPYLTFWATWLPFSVRRPLRTKTKMKTVTPKWEDSEVPVLHTLYTDIAVLMDHPLTIAVMDFDRGNADDRMGAAHLNLSEALFAGEKTMFRVPIIADGMSHGWITGDIMVTDTHGKALKAKRTVATPWEPSELKDPVPLQPGTGMAKKRKAGKNSEAGEDESYVEGYYTYGRDQGKGKGSGKGKAVGKEGGRAEGKGKRPPATSGSYSSSGEYDYYQKEHRKRSGSSQASDRGSAGKGRAGGAAKGGKGSRYENPGVSHITGPHGRPGATRAMFGRPQDSYDSEDSGREIDHSGSFAGDSFDGGSFASDAQSYGSRAVSESYDGSEPASGPVQQYEYYSTEEEGDVWGEDFD